MNFMKRPRANLVWIGCVSLLLLGCEPGGGKKVVVSKLDIAQQGGINQDVTAEDATINLSAEEVFELNLQGTGGSFPKGSTMVEVQFMTPEKNPKLEANKTRCPIERNGDQLKLYIRLLAPEDPMEGFLNIAYKNKVVVKRKVKVVKKG